MDVLEVLHRFASACAKALEDAKVAPPEGYVGAVMVIVADKTLPNASPLGASLNYEDGRWTVLAQIEPSEKVEEGEDSVH